MRHLLALPLLLVACKADKPHHPGTDDTAAPDSGETADTGDTYDPNAPVWDTDPDPVDCAADLKAPLYEAALANANIARDDVGYSETEYAKASYHRYLGDPFLMSWFRALQQKPADIPCFVADRTSALESFATIGRPATGALWTAMQVVDVSRHDAPLNPRRWPDLQSGLDDLLAATGDTGLTFDDSALPEGLGAALGPVFGAMARVVLAWQLVADGAPYSANRLSMYGHSGGILDLQSLPDLTSHDEQDWVLSDTGPRSLYAPTLDLAYAVETAGLDAFKGQGDEGLLFSLATSKGLILVYGPGADAPGELDDVLFYLDLGGDDTYVHATGANGDGQPLSVMVDLGGNDTYGYVAVPDPNDGKRLPSDAKGRYAGDENYGPFSLSKVGRAGSGRFGVGLLFDLGSGDDAYASLRMSEGWGHLGVGILADDGGNDDYAGEAGVQGAAAMGIGLLLDGGGNDGHRTYTDSQGFGYTQGVGILFDRGEGTDVYFADPGNPAVGGDPMYYSPQMPGVGNSTFSQGSGFGMRDDADSTFLSGGFGLLRDGGGDDVYTASTFGQGSGYWQGLGALSDAGGNDSYDAYYYVQGGAAHYSIGVLLDGGGNDRLNQNLGPTYMQFGAGHDFSIGMYVDESGDDTYTFAGLAAGASNCQGIGILVDNSGTDTYTARSTYSLGLGNHSGECNEDSGARYGVHSIGLFMDSGGGADTYDWPADDVRSPANDSSFGIQWAGTDDEHGGAVDGDGETAFHAAGAMAR
jgi:hypothetical protein